VILAVEEVCFHFQSRLFRFDSDEPKRSFRLCDQYNKFVLEKFQFKNEFFDEKNKYAVFQQGQNFCTQFDPLNDYFILRASYNVKA